MQFYFFYRWYLPWLKKSNKCKFKVTFKRRFTFDQEILPEPVHNEIIDGIKSTNIATIIRDETSRSAYNRLRKALIEDKSYNKAQIPSYYLLNKNRPLVKPFIIVKDKDFSTKFEFPHNINETIHSPIDRDLQEVNPEYTTSSFINTGNSIINDSQIDFKEAFEKLQWTKKVRKKLWQ